MFSHAVLLMLTSMTVMCEQPQFANLILNIFLADCHNFCLQHEHLIDVGRYLSSQYSVTSDWAAHWRCML